MKRGYAFAKRNRVAPLKKWVGKWAPRERDFGPRSAQQVAPGQLFLVALLSLVIGVVLAVTLTPPEIVGKVQRKEFFV